MPWAFNTKHQVNSNGFVFSTSRDVSISEHDRFVAFAASGEAIEFRYSARVGQVVRERDTQVAITFDSLEPIDHGLTLSDLTYTLKKVYRHRSPERHFRRAYVWLDELDFDSIRQGSVFWARTVFARFANALPPEVLMEFLQALVGSGRGPALNNITFGEGLNQLVGFIKGKYLEPVHLFEGIDHELNTLNSHLSEKVSALSVDDGEQPPDPLAKQAGLFRELGSALGSSNDSLFDSLLRRAAEARMSEEKYEKAYEGTRWPLQTIEPS